jgi:hypothetical protein
MLSPECYIVSQNSFHAKNCTVLRARYADVAPQLLRMSQKTLAGRGNAELHRFLQIAAGSASEFDYHLLLARDLHFLREPEYRESAELQAEVRSLLTSLSRKVDLDRSLAKC